MKQTGLVRWDMEKERYKNGELPSVRLGQLHRWHSSHNTKQKGEGRMHLLTYHKLFVFVSVYSEIMYLSTYGKEAMLLQLRCNYISAQTSH